MNIAEAKTLSDWAGALKPGDDAVICLWARTGPRYTVCTVRKLLPTQVVVEDALGRERRFGRQHAGLNETNTQYGGGCLRPLDQQVRNVMEHERLAAWLSGLPAGPGNGWKNPPLHLLRAMKAAYDKAGEDFAKNQGYD